MVRQRVWHSLKGEGFTRFTSRTGWRVGNTAINVVNFQSFNRYLADTLGCTTFSFGVNLGVYYPSIDGRPWASSPASDFPEEYACHVRKHLTKDIKQEEFPRLDVWYVANDGTNLEEVVDDAGATIRREGLPWLDQLSSLSNALQVFMERESTGGGGFGGEDYGGALGSPARLEAVAGVALELGREDVAREALEALAIRLEGMPEGSLRLPHYSQQVAAIRDWLRK